MNGASRKVKNPLLSAAGEGFPFENYGENTFLVPVTPSTPAVLRDDAELDNFVEQEAINSHDSNATGAPVDVESEFTPIPLHPEEIKEPTNQPPKQGYLTSILSSLPNLSLSSITGDTSVPEANRGIENVTNVQNANPFVPSHDQSDPLGDALPPVIPNFHDPRHSNFPPIIEVNPGSGGTFPAPPQSTLPPSLPSSNNAPVSYRLGNQRRLKYAPPPDLTSNAPKQYNAPSVQPLLAPQGASAPTIFNPNEPIVPTSGYQTFDAPLPANPSSLQRSTPEFLSQSNSLQGSFRSSPVIPVIPHSSAGTSRSITPLNSSFETVPVPERSSISSSAPQSIPAQVFEPATPQNTPANTSFFSFETSERDFPHNSFDPEKETVAAKSSLDQAGPPVPILKNSEAKSSSEPKPAVTFAPVFAVQVSEKLEHLLAEQKEDSPSSTAEAATAVESIALQSQIDESSDLKSNSVVEKSDPPQLEGSIAAFRGQETPELPQASTKSPEVGAARQAKPDVPAGSHGPSTNVPSTQQYYQQLFPSSADFFAEKPAEQRSSLNYVPDPVPSASKVFASSNAFGQSPSSFFSAPDSGSAFLPCQTKERDIFVHSGSTGNDFQPASLTSSTTSTFASPSTVPAPQIPRDASQSFQPVGAKCGPSGQSQPTPQFYNPAQFQSELTLHSPVNYPHASPVASTRPNQAYNYFEDYAVRAQTHDTAIGIGNAFHPTPFAVTAIPEPTGSATLNPVQMSINPLGGRATTDSVPPSFQNLAVGSSEKRMQYRAVSHYWFYRKEVEHKVLWHPFSMQDSRRLEEVHNSTEITPETTVATDGGRYDVDILRRQRSPVYWAGTSTEVRRCSWFFKGPTESRYIPYDETIAAKLEEEYKQACSVNNWNRRIDLNNGEYIVFHSASVQVHYMTTTSPELGASWGNSAGSEDSAYLQGASSRPRVIKRGMDDFHIDDGEPEKVDHLLFLVHGIGSVCDLKFRSVEEVVDEFRSISLQLVQSHYRSASEQGIVNRIEVLPISWHTTLHSEDTGIDKKLNAITLESIPKLRHFTNDTLLDILFYTSPVYCQTIMETVGNEINRLYALFKERNPSFDGGIYLGGHSLGSLILFDLLCHQKPPSDKSPENDVETKEEQMDGDTGGSQDLPVRVLKRRHSKKISYVIGAAGTGQPYIHYPQLHFHPRAFFALGSPIGMFVTVRGIDMLGEDFVLPTCPSFFNIFHPFDPVAYRVEALINSDAPKYRPMLIPHHKGRKRMHLELKETMARVGADLKQKLLDSVRNTWNSVYQLALFHKPDNTTLEREIDKVVEEQLQQTVPDQQLNDDGGAEFKVGKLNGGRRIDYVLQEAPFEYINEYIFALTSHVCYWESEDTMLMMLKEIYGSSGIQTDTQLPQQTLSIERVPPATSLFSPSSRSDGGPPMVPVMRMDPTAPVAEKLIGPPPKSGFVRKS